MSNSESETLSEIEESTDNESDDGIIIVEDTIPKTSESVTPKHESHNLGLKDSEKVKESSSKKAGESKLLKEHKRSSKDPGLVVKPKIRDPKVSAEPKTLKISDKSSKSKSEDVGVKAPYESDKSKSGIGEILEPIRNEVNDTDDQDEGRSRTSVDKGGQLDLTDSTYNGELRRSKRKTKGQHSNPYNLPKSTVKNSSVSSHDTDVLQTEPAEPSFEVFSNAVAMLGNSLGQTLQAGWKEFCQTK